MESAELDSSAAQDFRKRGDSGKLLNAPALMSYDFLDPAEYIAADLEFHNTIVRSCGNVILAQFTYSIAAALRAGRAISIQVPGGWEYSCALHKSVLEAIQDRDPEGAAASTIVIINKAVRDIRAVLASKSLPQKNTLKIPRMGARALS